MVKKILLIVVVLSLGACSKGYRVSFGVSPISAIHEEQHLVQDGDDEQTAKGKRAMLYLNRTF